jgi:P4 family phage/plasmid primase-like protien
LELCHLFNKIKQHYIAKSSSESTTNLIKNIKSLVTKLNKPQLKDDILKESQLFYVDTEFYLKLNSKKHLVPFENGVYDLLSNNFRKTKKEDWINYTVRFDYDPKVRNSEVYQFIESILPNRGVRDYVLKKMSECLNGDIPNTNFLMFIGDGANGKSQLLNLMKAALGEFGEKVEVTLLTRKRNNANEANTEKIKLMNKRFAFLSEPEDGEKINIGLLKELTGSEEIVARGLYQDSISFVMEAKLFLACNELPEIKGEDTALWRRIRVIDFPSRFVDDPKEPGEYKIDRTLPSRMREDISWRQTFINILLEYYYLDVPEPEEVKVKTNEYRQENNDFYNWLEENIVYKEDSVLNLKDICKSYYNKDVSKREKTKCRKELEKWISKKFVQLDFQCKESRFNGIKYNGWKGITFKNEYD